MGNDHAHHQQHDGKNENPADIIIVMIARYSFM